jgi:hypothetical protein
VMLYQQHESWTSVGTSLWAEGILKCRRTESVCTQPLCAVTTWGLDRAAAKHLVVSFPHVVESDIAQLA